MKKILLFLMAASALSCSSDDTPTPESTALNLITGINCRQSADDVPLQLGNPNVLINNKFTIYPNPANAVAFIAAQSTVSEVWVVPATAQKLYQGVDFSSILNSTLYTEQAISSQASLSLNGQSSANVNLDLSTLPKGYYKVFVKMGGTLYWDNLYKYDNEGDNLAQFNAINNFWN